jgi:hypothetical protein
MWVIFTEIVKIGYFLKLVAVLEQEKNGNILSLVLYRSNVGQIRRIGCNTSSSFHI